MKRILALDGGGIRGVFSLAVLLRMQTLLREWYGKPDMVLADHFDLFAGTSTGAIIATSLCWGMTVDSVLDIYVKFGGAMFTPVPWYRPVKKFFVARYEAKPLGEILRRVFSEDGDGTVPALLSSKRLKKGLLVVVRNLSTGSAWPLTNNPAALYNNPALPDCNLNIPLWKVVRASTAAPMYFDPEEIVLGGRTHYFVDGGITPYNNPALIAGLTAVLPDYNMNWEPGPDNIRLVSVGTMRLSTGLADSVRRLWLGNNAAKVPLALMQGVNWEQDYFCRCLGQCIYGESLDSEVGDLVGLPLEGKNWFSYVRYNKYYDAERLRELLIKHPNLAKLDAIAAMPVLEELGRAYAEECVKVEHLI
jgi:patatin-like phospholipase/acyl hydrolase